MFFLPSPRIIMFSPSFRWFVGLSADYAETYFHKTLIGCVFLSRRDPVNSSWGSPDKGTDPKHFFLTFFNAAWKAISPTFPTNFSGNN